MRLFCADSEEEDNLIDELEDQDIEAEDDEDEEEEDEDEEGVSPVEKETDKILNEEQPEE